MMWWIAAAIAGPETGIAKLLDDGSIAKAQEKCERIDAKATSNSVALREVCADAMWHQAELQNTYAVWVRFRTDWAGTKREPMAHERAAEAKLAALGETGTEADYTAFLTEFGATRFATTAKDLQARAAFREVSTVEGAIRLAQTYPTNPGLELAIQPWFQAFVKVETDGDDISVRLEPELPIPGASLSAGWAGRFGGDPIPLDEAVVKHLGELGVPKALVQQYGDPKRTVHYPPCTAPGMELGVHVTYGSLSTFHPVERACGGTDPGFLSEEGDRIVGLTLAPGVDYRFGVADAAVIEWVSNDLRTSIPLLGERQDEIVMVGPVLGQQVGALWLLHPIAGGMPWYVAEAPPPSVKPIPGTLVSLPLPEGVTLVGTATGDTRLEKAGQPAWTRSLPPGKVRVMSPWLTEITGLHDGNPALGRPQLDPLPADFVPDWRPLPDVADRDEVRKALLGFGVTLTRAWSVELESDGQTEVLFEGRFKGSAVKGVLDRRGSGSYRLFVFYSPRTSDPLVFSHQGHTWIGFRSDAGLETLCVEPRGLIRRLRP